ncbi:DHH family phosphoesterase [Peptoniphilus catoniae]|uniref:DHH family phosphoesterase n=1 Tax=Peptoniphilus catoniae TaxID=1660341 RepID=UPI0010FF3ABE|nr:bifunctional oligoribonuclease/PAP phosphatase NrnA [Peptoniphilus catoniae]
MKINLLKESIEKAQTISLISHLNPDGDNIGSLLGFYNLLKSLKKDVYLIIDDTVPDFLKFLPGINESIKSTDLDKGVDLFITLDCADLDRIGKDAINLFNSAKITINIDHHITNTEFADVNIVDKKSPATGELLFNIFTEIGYDLNKEIATPLYAAISSDTGSFKYDSTRPETFYAAAKLMEYGVNINEIAVNLYQRRSLEKTNLLISAMDTIEFFADNKIAIVYIDDYMIEKSKAKKSDAEGIVEFVRDIEGVEIAIFMKIKKDSIKLSLRTKSYINAINIASKFGGGGHVRAAGATMNLPFKDRKEEIIKYAKEELYKRNTDN